jgi:acetate kinase
MNILTLKPGLRAVEYSFFGATAERPRSGVLETTNLLRPLTELRDSLSSDGPRGAPDALAIRMNFGGTEFREPVFADDEVIPRLKSLVPQAPFHLPIVLAILTICRTVFPNTPVVLLFETAFFAGLPPRESTYGIDKELSETLRLRRYGYYGLLHEAACEYAAREHRSRNPRSAGRLLSICLEAHPEVAAVIGRGPLMCTSGATPLEGIPGHTSCGELDPSIVLMLSRELKWGPEQINTVLTQQSGLMGLVGRPVMLDDVLAAESGDLEPAKNLLQNRILMACGAGMAAMGGVDHIVFSGRFASAGLTLGPWLRNRLTFRGGNENSPPEWLCFSESLDRVMARKAEIFLLESEWKRTARADIGSEKLATQTSFTS